MDDLKLLNIPKEKDLSEVSREWFWNIADSGLYRFDFKKIIHSAVLPKNIFLGNFHENDWYLTEYGILCYAYQIGGYLHKTRLTYYGHATNYTAPIAKAFILPYSQIETVKYSHVWFLNRNTKPTLMKALAWYKKDMELAKKYYLAPYKAASLFDIGRHDSKNCVDGVYWEELQGKFWIEKLNTSHHYYFVPWLTIGARELLENGLIRKHI